MKRNIFTLIGILVALIIFIFGCTDADVVSHNISKSADQFKITRRIVFYNGITGDYMLTIQGRCSLGNMDRTRELSVTCMVGPKEYKKHFLGLSDNVTYFVEQIDPDNTNPYRYRVIFKPLAIVPDIDIVK